MSDLWILGVDGDEEAPRRSRRAKGGGRRRRRRRRNPLGPIVAIVVVLGLSAGIFYGGRIVWDRVATTPDYTGSGTGSVTIEVQDGDTAADIAVTLQKADVVKSEKAFNDAAKQDTRSRTIQPGFYTLRKQMSGADALALLLDPAARSGRITVPEGQSVEVTLKQISEKSKIPLADLQKAVADVRALGLPAYSGGRAEGFLFPATYDIPEGTTAVDLVKMMVANYRDNVDDTMLQDGARALGRSPYEVLVVASLLEEEGIADDFGKVSRVLYNRLDEGMRLQLDSTVNYALHRNHIRVSEADTQVDSPYNTYMHEGLPPTPISNPGLAAIQAALNPEAGPWLYFVKANKDGHSAFATTLAEHNANVAKAKAEGVF